MMITTMPLLAALAAAAVQDEARWTHWSMRT